MNKEKLLFIIKLIQILKNTIVGIIKYFMGSCLTKSKVKTQKIIFKEPNENKNI